MEKTWPEFFKTIKQKEYFNSLIDFINHEYELHTCFPRKNHIFHAFNVTPLKEVKVVIFGQDPYHEVNQAMGLAFSVNKGVKVPPSLINIFKEIENEFKVPMDYTNGDLTYLAKQGVLLLNSILTVQEGKPLSHNTPLYANFFKDVLTLLNSLQQPIVFLLWGGYAKSLAKNLNNPNHLILTSNHPSPLSANKGGWFNNNHFKMSNDYLIKNGLKPINWCNK